MPEVLIRISVHDYLTAPLLGEVDEGDLEYSFAGGSECGRVGYALGFIGLCFVGEGASRKD